MWQKQILHKGLNAYRLIKGQTQEEVEQKAASQLAIWDERWKRRVLSEQARETRQRRLAEQSYGVSQTAAAKALALERTYELEEEREALEQTLLSALDRDPSLDWEKRKDVSQFDSSKPIFPFAKQLPPGPDRAEPRFTPTVIQPKLSLLDKIIPSRRDRVLKNVADANALAAENSQKLFDYHDALWRAECKAIEQFNDTAKAKYYEDVRLWNVSRIAFVEAQQRHNERVESQQSKYLAADSDSLIPYLEDVLSQSEYPDSFPREQVFQYSSATRTLALDFELPNQSVLPKIKEVKYVASRSGFQEVPISEAWIKKTYDDLLYQIALRTLYELFKSDQADFLTAIVFNGWVRSIDRATGAEVHACVMSLEARKDEFLAINLKLVDPKACFKKLKGVSASKLIELSPVKPLMTVNREDRRFVEGYGVADSIDDRTNLAAMDWLDFENLIREVFGKEFSKGGGEVKITQASRDGGVDAIAFDPDPIRGGKVVIQAKRYTNTVGVAAVRDLYGTVHNEGANKGILVTTSDFGPDAYSFAKDKPLTLLSGGELLYLLGQHGHSAKIDLTEAKRLAAEAS
jgi:restriction system protein